jgi:hypothetical protein
MNDEKFEIDGDNVEKLKVEMLILISTQLRALTEFEIKSHCDKTGENFEQTTAHFDKTMSFHRKELLKSIYSSFGSLAGLLPPQVEPSKD